MRAKTPPTRLSVLVGLSALLAGLTACGTQEDLQASDGADGRPAQTVWVQAVVECLQKEGWPDARATADGLEVPSVTPDQQDAFKTIRTDCERRAGPMPATEPLSMEDIDRIHGHLVASQACIEAQGFELRAGAPPSRQAFIDVYLSGNSPWSPFVGLDDQLTSASDWDELIAACPQLPQ